MRSHAVLVACWSLLCSLSVADSNITARLLSHQILPESFKPPSFFKNVNLMRNINLEKGYVRVTVNVVIENTDKKPQLEYFIPFKAEAIGHVGGLEVRDKKNPEKPSFRAEVVEYDPNRYENTSFRQRTFAILIHVLAQHNSTVSLSPPLLAHLPNRHSQSPIISFPPSYLYQPRSISKISSIWPMLSPFILHLSIRRTNRRQN